MEKCIEKVLIAVIVTFLSFILSASAFSQPESKLPTAKTRVTPSLYEFIEKYPDSTRIIIVMVEANDAIRQLQLRRNDTPRKDYLRMSYRERSSLAENLPFIQQSKYILAKYGEFYSGDAKFKTREKEGGFKQTYFLYLNAFQMRATGGNIAKIANLEFVYRIIDGEQKLKVPEQVSELRGESKAAWEWDELTTANWGYDSINIEQLHNMGYKGYGKKIAIIDVGLDEDHPAVNKYYEDPWNWDKLNVYGASFYTSDGDDWDDDNCPDSTANGHGTKDAGVVWQCAPHAYFYICETLLLVYQSIDAVEWANAQGCQVITTSLNVELDTECDGDCDYCVAFSNAADYNTTIVCASGNYNNGNGTIYPACPGNGYLPLSVSSHDSTSDIYTNGSPHYWFNGKPNLAAPGRDITTLDLVNSGYVETGAGGSSFAAPHVAGSTLILRHINDSPRNVEAALESSAVDIPGTDLDGHGRIDVYTAYGYLHPQTAEWLQVPNQESQTSISMSLIESADPGVEYYFDCIGSPTGGGGGDDSGWRSGHSYIDEDLETNHRYGYIAKARNGIGEESGWTSSIYAYTDIQTPQSVTFGWIGTDYVEVKATGTLSGLTRDSSGVIIYNAADPSGMNSGWQQTNDDYWTFSDLDPNIYYEFYAQARNGDKDLTPYSQHNERYTWANIPLAPLADNITTSTVELSFQEDDNPSYTKYAVYNETLDQWINASGNHTSSEVWQTRSEWGTIQVKGLEASTTYSFRFKARNQNQVQTDLSLARVITTEAPNGVPVLSGDYLTPSSGDSQTPFTFHIEYTDPEAEQPTIHRVVINGQNNSMNYVSGSYDDHAVYELSTTLPVGEYDHYYSFSDGHTLVETDTYSGPSVIDPDFAIVVEPDSQVSSLANTAEYDVITASIGGFSYPITLSLTGLPASLDYDFSENPVTPGDSCVLSITPDSSATEGIYAFEIQGTSSEFVRNDSAKLTLIYGTEVYGTQAGVWPLSGSPYLVTGDVEVPVGQMLEIESGVEINFQGHYEFNVYGTLRALGTQSDSIQFTTDDQMTGWGGLRFQDDSDESMLTYCIIEYGKSPGYGGGLYMKNTDMIVSHSLVRNSVTTSERSRGGGIYIDGGKPILLGVEISNNAAYDGYGSGAYIASSSARLFSCNIHHNYSDGTRAGGGLSISGDWSSLIDPPEIHNTIIANNSSDHDGGGVKLMTTEAIFKNCVIADNYVIETGPDDEGGGIYKSSEGVPTLVNCILWGNDAHGNGNQISVRERWDEDDSLEVSYCDIQNYSSTSHVTGPVIIGPGMLNSDPQFGIDYQLNPSSPCVDEGDSSTADALLPPGQGSVVLDMGAYGGCINYLTQVPGLFVNPQALEFRQVKTGTIRSLEVVLKNLSTDVVDLESVTASHPNLTFYYSSGQISTLDSTVVRVDYSPSSLDTLYEEINIAVNGDTLNYLVSGEGVEYVTVYGEVSGTWHTEDSPIYVIDDLVIPEGEVLTIEPGVEVVFQGEYKIDVYGDILAYGAENDTVHFHRTSGYWAGMRVYNSNNCEFHYTILEKSRKTGDQYTDIVEQSGGVLYVDNSNVIINHSRISNNSANRNGGALYIINSSDITISNSRLINNGISYSQKKNISVGGGAIALYDQSILSISDTRIRNNYLNVYEYNNIYGGGIYVHGGSSKVSIHYSNISCNTVINSHDKASCYGGGIASQTGCELVVSHCELDSNLVEHTASYDECEDVEGGGIFSKGKLFVSESRFSYNTLNNYDQDGCAYGGGLSLTGGDIYNNAIFGNSCNAPGGDRARGGGIMHGTNIIGNIIRDNSCTGPQSHGGGIYGGGNLYCANNVIYGNTLSGSLEEYGGGIFTSGELYNNILYANEAASGSQLSSFIWAPEETLVVDYCLIQDYLGSGSYQVEEFGDHMLDETPLFRDVGSYDFRLQLTSPCIDTGHPNLPDACLSDSAGLGTTVADLGAYGGPLNCGDTEVAFLTLIATALDFGIVYLGEDSTLYLELSNFGTDTLWIDSLSITGSDSLQFGYDFTTPAQIASGEEVLVPVIYAPTYNTSATALLSIYSNNIFGTKSVSLSGQGVTPEIVVSPTELFYGDVLINTIDTLSCKVYNQGNGDLIVSDIVVSDTVFSVLNDEFTLVSGDSIDVPVIFCPVITQGYTDTAIVLSNDDTTRIPLTGTGVAPGITLSTGVLSFGHVLIGQDSTLQIKVYNTGTADLHVNDIVTSQSDFSVLDTQFVVIPSDSHSVNVTFAPSLHKSYSELLEILSDADTVNTSLFGNGYDFAYSDIASPAGVDLSDLSKGAAWADYDLDGNEDLFVVNTNTSSVLFRNSGDSTFTDRTLLAEISINGPAYAAVWGDYDNDGDPDLYVTLLNQENVLYQNQGDGTFLDFSSFAGVNDNGPSKGASWVDYDKDGYLDLFVCNYGAANRLYQNQGDGTFADVAPALGLDHVGHGTVGVWDDYDLDNDQDLYVANLNDEPNLMYRNDDSIFVEVGGSLGVAGAEKSKAALWGDYDGDGDPDLYVVNWSGQANRLYRNDLGVGFIDVADTAGVADEGYGNGAAWVDYDSDGPLDLVLVTWNEDSNLLYRNRGDGSFESFSSIAGIDDELIARSVSCCDFDRDGWADLYIAVDGAENILYHNDLDINNWLTIALEGVWSNRSAVGAAVDIHTAGQHRRFSVASGEGHYSGNSFVQHIGMGSLELVDSLVIHWPSGYDQVVSNVTTNQHLDIVEEIPPVADFIADTTSGYNPLMVNFTDLSTPGTSGIVEWKWHFGNGDSSNLQNPNYIYTEAGVYAVSLTVSDGVNSDTETKVDCIRVGGVKAEFVVDVSEGLVPLTVQFIDSSLAVDTEIISWEWDFDNDDTTDSEEQNPSWTYDEPGIYTLSLTVSDGISADTETKTGYIIVGDLIANFEADITEGHVPLTVQFSDSTIAVNMEIISWAWDFDNDDTTDSGTRDPLWTYDEPGIYTVNLTVSANISSGTKAKTVNKKLTHRTRIFSEDSDPDFRQLNRSQVYNKPGRYDTSFTRSDSIFTDTETKLDYVTAIGVIANFGADTTTGYIPLMVQFSDSSIAVNTEIISWVWNFDNNDTTDSEEQSPSWTYEEPGLYTVSLTVSDSISGDTETKTDYITVSDLIANFSADTTEGYAPLTIQFSDSSRAFNTEIISWAWDFDKDDTTDSEEQNPSWTYEEPGIYTVSLTVSDSIFTDIETKGDYIAVFTDPIVDSGLVAFYPFTGNANDESGNENHGMVHGPIWTEDRFGRENSAYNFDGVDDYIEIPDDPTLDTGEGEDVTVVVWVQTDSQGHAITKYRSVSPRGGFRISWSEEGKPQFHGRDRNGYRMSGEADVNIFDSNWHMLVGMREGSVWSIWVDGYFGSSNDVGDTAAMDNDMPLIIGNDYDVTGLGNDWINGKLDDIRIYNRALTETEIKVLYDSNPPETIDNLAIGLVSSDIYLWWTEPYDDIGVSHYVVYRGTGADSSGDSLAGTADTTYTDVGAAGDVSTNYFYTVKVVDAVGNKSEASNRVGEFDRSLSTGK